MIKKNKKLPTYLGLCNQCGLSVAEGRERQSEISLFVPLETHQFPRSQTFGLGSIKCTAPCRHRRKSSDFLISLGPAQSPKLCFIFSSYLSQTDEMGRREAILFWRSYLLAIHFPRDAGLVKTATVTTALIMRTMRINNERHESTVATFMSMSLMMTKIHNLLFRRTFIVLLKRTLQT